MTATNFPLDTKHKSCRAGDFISQLEAPAREAGVSRRATPHGQRLFPLLNGHFITPLFVLGVKSRSSWLLTAVQVLLGTGRRGQWATGGRGQACFYLFIFFYTSHLNSKGVHLNKTFEISWRETLNTYFIWKSSAFSIDWTRNKQKNSDL